MVSFKPHYAGLDQYLRNHPYVRDRWKALKHSIGNLIDEAVDRYSNRTTEPPPVVHFTTEQKELYSEIFYTIRNNPYRILAALILGVPPLGEEQNPKLTDSIDSPVLERILKNNFVNIPQHFIEPPNPSEQNHSRISEDRDLLYAPALSARLVPTDSWKYN